MKDSKNQQVFLELLRAGLWGGDQRSVQEFHVQQFKDVDWNYIYQLALEQSVQGLVLQGIDSFRFQVSGFKIPQELLLQWIGEVQMIEQQNKAMNEFVAWLIELLRKEDIYALLEKGQGIAQRYEKPLWRSCGDVDLLLSEDNYERAKKVLLPLATDVETEYSHFKHQGMTINGWVVELHGTLHSRLSGRVDRMIDEVQKAVFYSGKVRSVVFNSNPNDNANLDGAMNNSKSVQVFLPAPDEDVIFVFTHILHHFYIEGIGLRQICDWCRLLWTYKDFLNHGLLESRIRKMGLMSEWKAFAALAVDYLGMPVEAMPLLDSSNVQEFKTFKKKAERICEFILEVGSFGHNRKAASGKIGSAWNKMKDFARHTRVFPLDSFKFFFHFVGSGIQVATEKYY